MKSEGHENKLLYHEFHADPCLPEFNHRVLLL